MICCQSKVKSPHVHVYIKSQAIYILIFFLQLAIVNYGLTYDYLNPSRPLEFFAEMKGQWIVASSKQSPPGHMSSTFKHLGIGLALVDNRNHVTTSATATKHPRHRPWCMCIACIHPPSGGGVKLKPACMCNICTTINHRFFTPW